MTPVEDSEEIRALLREAHRDDELSCPPFQRLVGDARARPVEPRRRIRAVAVAAIAGAASVVAVVSFRGERPAPTARPVALASSARGAEGPLDFLLELPKPAPRDPLASLRLPLSSGSGSNKGR
jgi:hypothetical protein